MAGFAASESPENLVGSLLAGRYRLERLLGAGAMGGVYASTADSGEPCAVKVLRGELAGEEGGARLLREAKLVAGLRGPHVVPVLGAGHDVERDLPFLVMPLLEGVDLSRALKEHGPLHPEAAVRIAVQACAGLSEAHAAGIIHRDIKPQNLFLHTPAGSETTLKICDFGVAKRFELYDDTRLTWTGRFLGSPVYMSPEQAKSSKHVDERTDLFSLGVTLYEMLCGKPPFHDVASISDLVVAVCTRAAPPLQELAPWVEPGLAMAVHRALRRDRDQRWPSASAFAASLKPFAGGSEDLSPGVLRGVDATLRGHVALRADAAVESRGANARADEPSPPADADPLLDQVLGGRYRILRLLGKGGMGSVYEAECPDGKRVAAKVIAREVTGEGDEAVRRFVREARAATSIDDPHVVRVLDSDRDDVLGVSFIVMELLDGIDCSTLFKRQAPLEPGPLVRLFLQAGKGLAAAHRRGVIHRDIKPANIFLHVERGTGRVTAKIGDFGIAKSVGAVAGDETSNDLTSTGKLMGSPMYMSPEQARNAKNVDARTDVWSFAISLYEGLTGRRAWHGSTSLGEIILAICTEDLTPIRELAPWVDPELSAIVERGIARDPEKRWASIEQMIEHLVPHSEGGEEVNRDALQTVSPERRILVAPRSRSASAEVSAPALDTLSTMGASAHETSTRARPSRRRSRVAIAVAAVVVMGVGALAWQRRAPARAERPAPVDPSPATSTTTAALVPAPLAALVRIEPGDATARVDGVPFDVTNGTLGLKGKPGDVFAVTIARSGVETTTKVVLTSEGLPYPALISLEPKAVLPAAASGPAPVESGGKRGARLPREPGGVAPPIGDAPTPKSPSSPVGEGTPAPSPRPTADPSKSPKPANADPLGPDKSW
jgi:serine/threonine protein kinase